MRPRSIARDSSLGSRARPPRRSNAPAQPPDLVLLDIGLPDGSGFDVCRELRGRPRSPSSCSPLGPEADRVAGLELGADDYVVKPFSAREVAARVRAVLRRAAPVRRRGRGADHDRRAPPRSRPPRGDPRRPPRELSRKEFELFRTLMASAATVITREPLIDQVWDMNWFGSTKTLDVHVSALRKKLGDDPSKPSDIHTVRGVGFRFTGPDEAP